ncbi:MAG: PIN domain-containing protein [Patescibacteria group bacterium]
MQLPFIDTNVFLRFLIPDKKNPHLSRSAKKIFQDLEQGKLSLQTTILVISEIVYVLESYYGLGKHQVKEKVIPLLSLKNLILSKKENVITALNFYADLNVDFEDAQIYVEMIDHDIKQIYTFDQKHFRRFAELEILPNF